MIAELIGNEFSESHFCFRLQLQQVDLVNVERLTRAVERDDDGEPNCGFGGGDHHHKEDENVSVKVLLNMGECHRAQVHRVEHQFNGHELGADIAAQEERGHSDGKQDRAEDQVERHGHRAQVMECFRHQRLSFLAKTTAPKIAIKIRTLVTSKGSRKRVKSANATSCVDPLKLPRTTGACV